MNEKIDLTKILKDCPKGMELDCTMYDYVTLESVSNDINNNYPIHIKTKCGFSTRLTKYGQNVCLNDAKCVIFPKGKTTWEGFQRPFKDGDIVYYDKFVSIFKKWGDFTLFYSYISIEVNSGEIKDRCFGKFIHEESRFATEEEKQKLFDVIKLNGFKWNAETKTLEKVLEEDKIFKNGDIIVSTFNNIAIFSHTKKNDIGQNVVYYHCLYSEKPIIKFKALVDCGIGYVEECRLATEHEKKLMMEAIRKYGYKWNTEKKTLEKLIIPKFKVGDTIRTKNGLQTYEVTNVTSEYYSVKIPGCVGLLPVKDQDDYILIPNKFDPKTLKPFDKVLVRYNSESNWCVAFFSHIDNDLKIFCHKFVTAGYMSFRQMIPYNEETKHLLGTNEQAPEFYTY